MKCDPVADLLTRIRNASRAGHPTVKIPASSAKELLLKVLLEEGYIGRFEPFKDADGKSFIKVYLRYTLAGRPAISEISRVSSPGRRVYLKASKIPRCRGGLGIVVVSTSQGMLADREARKRGVGGEVICSVF